MAAQSAPITPRWDVGAQTGVFVSHPTDESESESWDDWFAVATLGLSAGRYLTPHLKLEGEAAFSQEGTRHRYRTIDVPNYGTYYLSSDQRVRSNSASGVLIWQFLENQWVHPFLFAGAAADFERVRVHTPRQSVYRGDPRIPGNETLITPETTEDLGTTARARALIGGGGKFYVSPDAFFRADTRIGIGSQSSGHVSFRLGFGYDF